MGGGAINTTSLFLMPTSHTNAKTGKISYLPDSLSFFVAGYCYSEGAKGFDEKADIILRPEPTNKYDKEAIAVYVGTMPIGYVPRPLNSFLRYFLFDKCFNFFRLSDFNPKRKHCEVQITMLP